MEVIEMDKTKMEIRIGLVLAMSVLMMCTLAVPAVAKNITDAECGTGFGAMPPEITEIPEAKGVNISLEGAGATVIWEDHFSTNPWSRWSYDFPIGWSYSGDYVYFPYWYDANHFTCAANMRHDFSTNPFYGSDRYVSPDEYSSWTTKTLYLNNYWTTTVTVNLPSDYSEVVCGYVRDMQVYLSLLILAMHTIYIERCINKVNKKSLTSYPSKAIKTKRERKGNKNGS
jgi:hypothetical protein